MKISSLKFFVGVFLLGGILLRGYHQFIEWSFNGDEVNLGLDIIHNSFDTLFYPFQSRQSAPPLFLLLEKFISGFAKTYFSFKILSFISSCASLFLFNRILKRSFHPLIQILLLALFCFNPFILINTLTLKQYSLDLTMGLIAVNYFVYKKESLKTFLFFCVFCLLSNVGLFFSAAFLVFHFINFFEERRYKLLNLKILKWISPYLLAPLPYLLFFIWFMNQPGSINMKSYMVNYWSQAFMPLDISIFKWLAIQAKGIYIFFFSTYWFIGLAMLILFFLSLYQVVVNSKKIFRDELLGIVSIYIISVCIHLVLSAFKIYPFSDRLFLYLAPGIFLIIGFGIEQLRRQNTSNRRQKMIFLSGLAIPFFAIISYLTYLPGKKNDVIGLMGFVNSTDKSIVMTTKAKHTVLQWLEFTDYTKKDPSKLVKSNIIEENEKADLLITIQSEKFGHTKKYTSTEAEVQSLLENNEIVFYDRVDGFAIYSYK
jgi:hypothetical protein